MDGISPWWIAVGSFAAGLVVGFAMGRSAPSVEAPAAPRAPVSADVQARVRDVLRTGNKIAAIKLYRELTGAGLKDAKDAVEALE